MKVAITGSTGFIGTALRAGLTNRGHQPIAIVRRAAGSEEIAWDIEAGTIEREKLASVDAVVHLAGESIAAKRWTDRQKKLIRDSRLRGTSLLSTALANTTHRPLTLISASAIGYYGDRGDEICDERTNPGDDFLARVCVEWENAAEPARQAAVRVVHPRIGLVLSRLGGALPKMLTPFRLGLGGRVGSGNQYWSWITLPDLVQALIFMLEREDLHGPLNATGLEPVTNRQFTKGLGRALHRPAVIPLPAPALRTMLGEMADGLLLTSTRAPPVRLMEAGFAFLHPTLDEAMRAVLEKSP